MKKYIYSILALLLVLIFAVIVPSFIDWSHYKGPIGTAVKTRTGFDIELKGPIHLGLFPTPHLTAKEVYIKNKPQGTAENFIVLKSLSLSTELIPLFSGKIIVNQVDLEEPFISLETFKNGKNNWDIDESTPIQDRKDSKKTIILPESSKTEVPKNREISLSLKKIKIKKGAITYKDLQTNTHHELKDVNLEGSLDSLVGPFFVEGQLELDGYLLKGNIKTGELTGKNSSPLDAIISVTKSQQNYGSLEVRGTIQDKKFLGDIKASALKIPFSLDLKNKKLDLQKGIQLAAHVDAEPENVKITNLTIALENLKILGNITYKASQLDLKLDLSEGTSHLGLSAKGQYSDKTLWNGAITIHSDSPQTFLNWVEADKLPYLQGAINISTHLNATANSYTLKSLNFTVGKIKGTGNILFQKDKTKPYINADLSLNALDLNILLAAEEKKASIPAAVSSKEKTAPLNKISAPANANGSMYMHWSKEAWNLEILKAINIDLKFSIAEVLYDVYQIHQLNGNLHLKEGNLQLAPFQAAGYGGRFNGTLSVHQGTPASIKVDGTIQGINVASLPQARHTPLKKAILGVSMQLGATGNSTWQAVNTLSGNIHLNLTNGVVEIFNVRKFVNDIKHIKTPADVYTLIQSLNTKADTNFTHLKGDFGVREGKATTHNLEFLSDEIIINAGGTINLPQWYMNMGAKIKIKELGKLPSLGMQIEGSLESPSYKMDEKILVDLLLSETANQLLNKAAKNIGGDVGKVINSVLGNEEEQKSGSKPQQNDMPIKPEKLLKNLLGL